MPVKHALDDSSKKKRKKEHVLDDEPKNWLGERCLWCLHQHEKEPNDEDTNPP